MFGGFGSTWGDNFYMGTQNGVETKDLTLGNFDYVFEVAPC